MTGISIAVANFAFVGLVLVLVWRVFRDVLHTENRVFVVAWFLGVGVAASCMQIGRAHV